MSILDVVFAAHRAICVACSCVSLASLLLACIPPQIDPIAISWLYAPALIFGAVPILCSSCNNLARTFRLAAGFAFGISTFCATGDYEGLTPWIIRSTSGAAALGASATVAICLIHPLFWIVRAVVQRLPTPKGVSVWHTIGLQYAIPAAVLVFAVRRATNGLQQWNSVQLSAPATPRVYDFTLDQLKHLEGFTELWRNFTAVSQPPEPQSLSLWNSHNNSENEVFVGAATQPPTQLLQFACWLRELKAQAHWRFDQAFQIGRDAGLWWPYGGLMLRISSMNGFHHAAVDPEEKALRVAAGLFLTRLSAAEDRAKKQFSFQGVFFYPPHGVREWHTNADKPGWRMYLVSVAEVGRSAFSYANADTGELFVIREPRALVRMFKIPEKNESALHHSIVSWSNRFSFGVNLYDPAIVKSLLCLHPLWSSSIS